MAGGAAKRLAAGSWLWSQTGAGLEGAQTQPLSERSTRTRSTSMDVTRMIECHGTDMPLQVIIERAAYRVCWARPLEIGSRLTAEDTPRFSR